MPSPSSSAEFLDLVQKSGLVEDKRLTAYPDKLRAATPSRPSRGAGEPADPGRHPHPFPGRTTPAGQVAALHHRQIQGAGTPRRRRHGQRLPVRTQADAPPGRRQGAADRQGRRPLLAGALLPRGPRRRRSRSSQHRPRLRHRPGRQAALPRHGARGRRQFAGHHQEVRADGRAAAPPITSARRRCGLQHAHERPAWFTATSSRATSWSIATASSKSSTWVWPASSTTRKTC